MSRNNRKIDNITRYILPLTENRFNIVDLPEKSFLKNSIFLVPQTSAPSLMIALSSIPIQEKTKTIDKQKFVCMFFCALKLGL